MANCKRCGREMSSFTFGELHEECADCRKSNAGAADNAAPAEANAAPARSITLRGITPATSVIIGINVAVMIGMIVTGGSKALSRPTNDLLVRWGADWGPLTFADQPWRVFTAMWVHAGLVHLFMNMWCLDVYGRIAERVFGWRTYLGIYVFTGLSGSLASLGWHPLVVSVGASAAVFGVVGSLVMPYKSGRLPMPSEVLKSASKSLITFVGYNLIIGAIVPAIDNSAHIGGLLGGLALGAIWSRLRDPQDKAAMVRVGAVAAILLVAAFFAVRHFRQGDMLAVQAAVAAEAGRNDEAITKAQAAIRRNHKDRLAYQVLGEAHIAKNQPKEAAEALEYAVQLNPKDEYSLRQLGAANLKLERYEDARRVLEQAVALNEKDASAQVNLGVAYWNLKRDAEALAHVQRSIEIDPDLAHGHYVLGLLQESNKQEDLALESFRRAVELEPQDGDYAGHLADLYEKNGKQKEADEVRRQAGLLK